jgi:hypothetical protein
MEIDRLGPETRMVEKGSFMILESIIHMPGKSNPKCIVLDTSATRPR